MEDCVCAPLYRVRGEDGTRAFGKGASKLAPPLKVLESLDAGRHYTWFFD